MTKRCGLCNEDIKRTIDGREYGHLSPCIACPLDGGRIKEKDGYRFCENWELHPSTVDAEGNKSQP